VSDGETSGAGGSEGAPSAPATTPETLLARAAGLGVTLTPDQGTALLRYLDVILEINRGINLTAVRDREDGVVRHLLDSLSIVPVWRELAGTAAPRTLLDVGTGGGFPGAVLACVWPEAKCLLIDGTGKKVRAVADALSAAGIGNAETMQVRASQLPALRPDTRGAFELATARAVAPAEELLRETRHLIASRGFLFAMKGPEPPREEIVAGEAEARRCGLNPLSPRTTNVPGLERRTVLVYRRRS
jgi:16S rRNA (guanine527-N7)-methyltransferase